MTRPSSKSALLRGSFTLLVLSSLVIIPNIPFLSWRAAAINGLQQQSERMGNPNPGKPEATLPNLDAVRAERPSVREVPIPIRSTIPSRKNPLTPWDGRRVGDPLTTNEPREEARLRKRAHARPRARVSAPTFMSEDAFIDNFYNWTLPGYTPLTDEKPYWRDQFRAAYAHGQGSLLLSTIEMGKTLFESKNYDERARDNHWYVYDLYKTYLMRDPDASGWAYWEGVVPTNGRENVRKAFEVSPEFADLLATIVPTGSASGNQISFVSSRVDPRTQPGNSLLTRDATWSVPILSLPGRAGLDLGLNLSYSSQVWTKSGPFLYFDEDNGFPSPGFRLGFPVVQRKTYDAQTNTNSYTLITSSGQRVELRQVGTSNVYEAGDSSYLQLTDNGNSWLVRSADGAQLTYAEHNNEYHCTEIKDRNGNYISVSYDPWGHITAIADTLSRAINFIYDANRNLLSITQNWNGTTHQWASFSWTTMSMQSSFSNVAVVAPKNNTSLPVLDHVTLTADGSSFYFTYTNSLQVQSITRKSFDNVQRSQILFTYQTPASDAPRITDSSISADNWTGINGVPAQVNTHYDVAIDGACVMTTPDNTVYKEYYGTGWQRGLITASEVWVAGVKEKWMTTTWDQDNTGLSYELNPRVKETDVYDRLNNRRRTTIDYTNFTKPSGATLALPSDVKEYRADASTVYRRTHTDYVNSVMSDYLNRHILSLPSTSLVYDESNNVVSKLGYAYDWSGAYLVNTTATPTQHDASYSTSFSTGRGNLSQVKQYDASDSTNETKVHASKFGYDINGSVVFTRDALDHQNSRSYADAFSDGVNRNTFAYPSTLTDADGFSSYVKYNFDFGATTRTEGPPPAGQTQGVIQTFSYYGNSVQLERVTTANNGAYKRFWYGAHFTASLASVNNVADEAYSVQTFDGLGRTVGSASNFPGSSGTYKATLTIYDQMGRAIKTSNPTEINESWTPYGDDAAGWLYTQQTYDWKGRPLITTNPDNTTKTAEYSVCGCAGGEVVTLTDEGTINSGVTKRKQQKVYSDFLGRTVKTEVLNWQGGSVYAATVNTYNARDQLTQVRQYAGAEGSGTYQDSTTAYDGYGRLQTRHLPEQQDDPNNANDSDHTTWTYNADNSIQSIKDARGALTSFSYSGNRGLATSITSSMTGKPNVTTSVTYDAVGNRTSMTDAMGSATYTRDQLSQLKTETRVISGLGTYSLLYDYNLGGALTSLTDPFGAQTGYSYDAAGRPTQVTGSGFGGVTWYVSTLTYRAWGGLKSLNYFNSKTLSLTYNARLQPSTYEVPGVIKKSYQYYDDASLNFTQDQLTTNSKFDRKYEYDHAGRITKGLSGQEARGGATTSDRPYNETHLYDEFNHLTSRFVRQWSRLPSGSGGTFSNNRIAEWQYDSDGRPVSGPTGTYSYDAAAAVESFGDSAPYKTDQQFDGDGVRLKSVLKSFDSQNNQWTVEKVTYYIHSTVLGGAVVSELTEQGGKEHTYVHWNGAVLAVQNVIGSTQSVQWKHFDASTATYRVTNSSGQIVESAEMDTVGANAGLFNSNPWPTPKSSGELQSYFSPADLNSTAECSMVSPKKDDSKGGGKGVDEVGGGIPMPCILLESMLRGDSIGSIKSYGFSMRSQHAVWIAKDTSWSTTDPTTQIPTIYSGPGGEYVWVDDPGSGIETWVQTKNPMNKGTPLPESEVDRLKLALESVLKDSTCSRFVEALLNQIGVDTNSKAFSNKAIDIFNEVRKQGSFGTRVMSDTAEGGSTIGNKDAFINIGKWTFANDQYALANVGRTMIHELLHVGSSTNRFYSHYDMFKAAYVVAVRMGGFTLTKKPGDKDPGGRDDANSYAFDDLLFQACRVR
jgi:YD repeat-containing protein